MFEEHLFFTSDFNGKKKDSVDDNISLNTNKKEKFYNSILI